MSLISQVQASSDTPEANVFVNVYDILPQVNGAARVVSSDWGIYHTGVEVHGLEYSFGGHDDSSTGVFCAKPRSAKGAKFSHQVPVGYVSLDPLELRQKLAQISREWPGDSYDPFRKNCNHFSDDLCRELTGQAAPDYINKFTRSWFVRGLFNRCLVPIGRIAERFTQVPSITYDASDVGDMSGEGDQMGICGARGINQVLVDAATTQKLRANAMFKAGSIDEARESYRKALGYISTMSRRTDEEDEVVAQAEAVRQHLLLNLAACDLKMADYASVVAMCDEVLRSDADCQKALFRKGVACASLGRLDEAAQCLRRVLCMAEREGDAPTVRDAKRELARVRQLEEAGKKKDRAFAKRMLVGAGDGDDQQQAAQ